MSLELWLAFVAASAVVTLIPGPCVLLLIGQSVSRGVSVALMSIIGILLGDLFLIVLSLVGVGAILAASATIFQIVKWAGVLYMAYLGCCQIADARKGGAMLLEERQSGFKLGSLKAGFLSAALNPKGIMFYVAFLTQFVNPEAGLALQLSILALTSSVVVGAILAVYVLIAGQARKTFQTVSARKRVNYLGGGCLLGGSALMAATR